MKLSIKLILLFTTTLFTTTLFTTTLFITGCNTTSSPRTPVKQVYTSNPKLFKANELTQFERKNFYGIHIKAYSTTVSRHLEKNDSNYTHLLVNDKTNHTYVFFGSGDARALRLIGLNNDDYIMFPERSRQYLGFEISSNMKTLMPNLKSDSQNQERLIWDASEVLKYFANHGLKSIKCNDANFECRFKYDRTNNYMSTFEYIDYNPAIDELESLLAKKEYDKALLIKFPGKFADKKVLMKALANTKSEAEYKKVSSIIANLNAKGLKGVSQSKSLELAFANDYKAAKNGSLQTRKTFLANYSYLNQDSCYSITATSLNIRSRPKKYSSKVGLYYFGEIICALDRHDGWVKTDDGWISADYIKKKNTQNYKSKLQDIAKRIDGGAFESAVKENTVSAYKDYLIDQPAGKHAKEATAKLIALYESEPSFNNYVRAYLASKKMEYLNKAEANLKNSSAKQDVDLELIDIYFDRKVRYISEIPDFVELLEHTKYKVTDFKKEMFALNGFGSDLTLGNAPHSVEYKYLLKELTLKANAVQKDDAIVINLSTDGFKKSFTYKADCEFVREDSGVRDTGFLESVFTLGASQAQYFYNVYNCKVTSKVVADAGIFGSQTGFNNLAGEIVAIKPWEHRSKSRDVSYSYNSGPTSSTSSRGIASVSFFEIQDVRASKGGTQFYSVGCSDGASGLAEITDVGRSYGSVCGTGGNLSTAVCKPKDTWSPRQAATLVCGGN